MKRDDLAEQTNRIAKENMEKDLKAKEKNSKKKVATLVWSASWEFAANRF